MAYSGAAASDDCDLAGDLEEMRICHGDDDLIAFGWRAFCSFAFRFFRFVYLKGDCCSVQYCVSKACLLSLVPQRSFCKDLVKT